MRLLEFLLDKYKFIGILIILGLGIHLALARFRWQFYPLYLLVGIYFILVILNNTGNLNINQTMGKWISAIGIFLFFISILALIVFPLEKIPKPSGKYSIGTRSYDLVDKSREAVYSSELSENRKIKFQIWYPSDQTKGLKKSKWIQDGKALSRHLANNMHLPAFALDHTNLIKSNSYIDAPINNDLENYPVVVISHGWLGFRELHTDFGEELASKGYIAISIDHTYGSQAVKFEDGSVAYLDPKALPDEDSTSSFANYANKLVTTYGEDVISVLDELEKLNKDMDFKDRLDLNRVGLLGHSTGGGGSVYAALKDPRVKAVMGLDAWVIPIESNFSGQGLEIPSLFIRSNQWAKFPNNKSIKKLIAKSQDSYFMEIEKSKHVDFSMAYMYSPVTKLIGFTGKLKGRKASEIQRDSIIQFFDRNFKDEVDYNTDYIMEIMKKYKELIAVDIK